MESAAGSPWQPFVHRQRLWWADTDAAGVAFSPRLTEHMLQAIDAWFAERLGVDQYRLFADQKIGTPFVELGLKFMSPVTPRGELAFAVEVTRLGRSSLGFAVEASDAGRICFTGHASCVFIAAAERAPLPIPEPFRRRIQAELDAAAARRAE